VAHNWSVVKNPLIGLVKNWDAIVTLGIPEGGREDTVSKAMTQTC
jgi:hypothetical protein